MAERLVRAVGAAVSVVVLGLGAAAVLRHEGGHPSTGAGTAVRSAATATTSAGPTPSPVPSSPSVTAVPPSPLTIVALGDSVPSASTCACNGYVEQLGTWLQHTTHRPTEVHNDAVDGWTSADVEESLRSRATRTDLAGADLVVIEIGANDFDFGDVDDPACFQDPSAPCWADAVRAMRAHLLRIVPAIRELDANPDLRVALAGYWNVTVDGEVGRARGQHFETGSAVLTRLVNTTIEDAAQNTGSLYVDFYTPLKGVDGSRDPTGELLADGDHPNQAGHTLLTQALVATLERTGTVAGWTSR